MLRYSADKRPATPSPTLLPGDPKGTFSSSQPRDPGAVVGNGHLIMTPTLDHTEPRQEGCSCTPFALCQWHYAALERHRAEVKMREWLRTFGTLPDPGAPER